MIKNNNHPKYSHLSTFNSYKFGFTLIEILIIIALIAILALAVFSFLNPKRLIDKAQDGRIKSDLNLLKKTFEDFYNDNNRYPTASEVCYNSQSTQRIDLYGKKACFCYICGNKTLPPQFNNFSPYLKNLPCDPKNNSLGYLYDFDCENNGNTPQWYRLYANLNESTAIYNEKATIEIGCHYESCGPYVFPKPYGYDYGVSYNNDLERNDIFAYCSTNGCNACGTIPQCESISIDKFCNHEKMIIPAAVCNKTNCPCQP